MTGPAMSIPRVRALDRNWVVRVLLFLNDQRLMRAYLNEIRPQSLAGGACIWRSGEACCAESVKPAGNLPPDRRTLVQIEHGSRKLAGMDWTKVIRGDTHLLAAVREVTT